MCRCTPNIKTPFCGKPGCELPRQLGMDSRRTQMTEQEFVDQYDHIIARRIARDVWRSRKGMQAGMPTVQLQSGDVESLLTRWKVQP